MSHSKLIEYYKHIAGAAHRECQIQKEEVPEELGCTFREGTHSSELKKATCRCAHDDACVTRKGVGSLDGNTASGAALMCLTGAVLQADQEVG
jgi:hypothetical protein